MFSFWTVWSEENWNFNWVVFLRFDLRVLFVRLIVQSGLCGLPRFGETPKTQVLRNRMGRFREFLFKISVRRFFIPDGLSNPGNSLDFPNGDSKPLKWNLISSVSTLTTSSFVKTLLLAWNSNSARSWQSWRVETGSRQITKSQTSFLSCFDLLEQRQQQQTEIFVRLKVKLAVRPEKDGTTES